VQVEAGSWVTEKEAKDREHTTLIGWFMNGLTYWDVESANPAV
jgi:hypothetical protein